MSGLDPDFGSENRSKAEYNWPPPNPKYQDSPEYRDRPRYSAPPVPPAPYQPPVTNFYPGNSYQPVRPDLRREPDLFLRAIWFLFAGWWLAILWLMAAYALLLTQIGTPLGQSMVSNLPKILFLQTPRPARRRNSGIFDGQSRPVSTVAVGQRVIWFVLLGWWLGILWTMAGYGLCTLVITEPLGMAMLDRLPAIITLEQN